MNHFNIDERFSTGLPVLLNQLPPLVNQQLDLQKDQLGRNLRLAVFQAFSRLGQRELTVDQITAAQLVELLALAATSNFPAFQPNKLSPSSVAQTKAGSYIASYLVAQFVNRLPKVGLSPEMTEELTVDGGDFVLAQLQRLQFNYNQRFTIADYLTDVKTRSGLLAAIAAKESAALVGADNEVIHLAGQIGQGLGTAFAISTESKRLKEGINHFIAMVTAGQYPLPLLFAIEKHLQWFQHFFALTHRPDQDQFAEAYRMTIAETKDAQEIANELLDQVKLDIKVLPSSFQTPLNYLVDQLIEG